VERLVDGVFGQQVKPDRMFFSYAGYPVHVCPVPLQ
jgi:hypothetical protein